VKRGLAEGFVIAVAIAIAICEAAGRHGASFGVQMLGWGGGLEGPWGWVLGLWVAGFWGLGV
jgi:hypothetical protein